MALHGPLHRTRPRIRNVPFLESAGAPLFARSRTTCAVVRVADAELADFAGAIKNPAALDSLPTRDRQGTAG
jgi:hypothetical protein